MDDSIVSALGSMSDNAFLVDAVARVVSTVLNSHLLAFAMDISMVLFLRASIIVAKLCFSTAVTVAEDSAPWTLFWTGNGIIGGGKRIH